MHVVKSCENSQGNKGDTKFQKTKKRAQVG